MSALLQNEALEINLNAEYGMCGRRFNKSPQVYVSDKYTSALFLVYTQNKTLPNRIQPHYRNHFTLFANETSVVIARTETTLMHGDNDAVICYDTITPIDNIEKRRRSNYKRWQVSFDNIQYSNNPPPSFVGYTLLCSGEFWYFDRGIILNGLSSYKLTSNQQQQFNSYSTFIYYELHVDHVIRRNQMQPAAAAAIPRPEIEQPEPIEMPRRNNTINPIMLSIPALSAHLLPRLNVAAQQTINNNDNVHVPQTTARVVVPTLHWFDERQNELESGSIEYFRPYDYKRPPMWR